MIHARPDYNGRIVDLGCPDGKVVPAEEPVLFLRGQDQAAPVAALAWANEHERLGGDPRLSRMVREHADKMLVWQATMKAKVADLPPDDVPG